MNAFEIALKLEQDVYNKILAANNVEAREYWLSIYEETSKEINVKISTLSSEIEIIKINGLTYSKLLTKQSGWAIFQLLIILFTVIVLLSFLFSV